MDQVKSIQADRPTLAQFLCELLAGYAVTK